MVLDGGHSVGGPGSLLGKCRRHEMKEYLASFGSG